MARTADGIAAGSIAAVLSGIPSTVIALARGDDPREATVAAGSILLPDEQGTWSQLTAAVPVHVALSLGWGVVLSALLPRRATIAWGAVAGLCIAALDLGLIGRRFARIKALPVGPQIADHVAYGIVVGAVLRKRRSQTNSP
ncbi:MAG: hypothetical protein ACRDJS_09690 [Actinomycetota bacterium]